MKKNIIENYTDIYFTNTKIILQQERDDPIVIYAYFIRKETIYACDLAFDILNKYNIPASIETKFKNGDIVPANEPLFFLKGKMSELLEIETLLLQKIGFACISAWYGYQLSKALPKTKFISMIARHCTGSEMTELLEYGVSIGSKKAQQEGYEGFIGCSTKNNIKYFNSPTAIGTMPHSLIGYAKSTLSAAKMYYSHINSKQISVLVDYFGKEVSDTLSVCNYFKNIAKEGNLSIRLDTHAGRYLEGLNKEKSIEIIKKYTHNDVLKNTSINNIENIIGKGVSAAAIYYIKEQLAINGFEKVKIIASSGFNLNKCQDMAIVKAPIDLIGTGSFVASSIKDTYTTADIISYNGHYCVKEGREDLIAQYKSLKY